MNERANDRRRMSLSPTAKSPRMGLLAGGLLTAVGVLGAEPAHAIIIRHDVPDSSYIVNDADFPAVVDLISPGDCIGTLISPSFLLTVAHCAVDLSAGANLVVAGVSHSVAEVIIHPGWNDQDNFDIALVRFSVPVTGVSPIPVYRGSNELDATITLVGRGTTATGLVGEDGGDTDGKLRRATNVVTDVDAHFFEIVFEPGNDSDTTALEGVGAAGDSGCPSFIDVNGVAHIAGLNSFGDADGNVGIGQYWSFDYQTRVSRYLDFIEAHVDFSEVSVDDPVEDPVSDPPGGDEPVPDAGSPTPPDPSEEGAEDAGAADDIVDDHDPVVTPDDGDDGDAPASDEDAGTGGDDDTPTGGDPSDDDDDPAGGPPNPVSSDDVGDEDPRGVTVTIGCSSARGAAENGGDFSLLGLALALGLGARRRRR